MADMSSDGDSSAETGTPAPASPPPRRGPGHRGADASDTAAEMARRAHEISLEAGSRMSGAMREVIRAAAGLSAFAIESSRELIHYMVRRGQMNADEADSLIAEAEAAYIEKHGALPKPEPPKPAAQAAAAQRAATGPEAGAQACPRPCSRGGRGGPGQEGGQGQQGQGRRREACQGRASQPPRPPSPPPSLQPRLQPRHRQSRRRSPPPRQRKKAAKAAKRRPRPPRRPPRRPRHRPRRRPRRSSWQTANRRTHRERTDPPRLRGWLD